LFDVATVKAIVPFVKLALRLVVVELAVVWLVPFTYQFVPPGRPVSANETVNVTAVYGMVFATVAPVTLKLPVADVVL
jgi:hypothetical protein